MRLAIQDHYQLIRCVPTQLDLYALDESILIGRELRDCAEQRHEAPPVRLHGTMLVHVSQLRACAPRGIRVLSSAQGQRTCATARSSSVSASQDKRTEVETLLPPGNEGLVITRLGSFRYMAKTKQQKQEILARLEEAFKTASSAVFVTFTQVTVADESEMRKQLREQGVKYFVAKKTLIGKALEKAGQIGRASCRERV